MPVQREEMIVRTITVDEAKASRGLRLTRANFRTLMTKDSRAAAALAAGWVEQAMGIDLFEDDARRAGIFRMPHPVLKLHAAIRTFNRGRIHLQQSGRFGVHRAEHHGADDMIRDVETVDYYIMVDMRRFPKLRLYPVRAARLMNHIHSRGLGTSGITPSQLDQFLRDNYDLVETDYDHARHVGKMGKANSWKATAVPLLTQAKR